MSRKQYIKAFRKSFSNYIQGIPTSWNSVVDAFIKYRSTLFSSEKFVLTETNLENAYLDSFSFSKTDTHLVFNYRNGTINLVPLSQINAENANHINFQVTSQGIEYKLSTSVSWIPLVDNSLIKGESASLLQLQVNSSVQWKTNNDWSDLYELSFLIGDDSTITSFRIQGSTLQYNNTGEWIDLLDTNSLILNVSAPNVTLENGIINTREPFDFNTLVVDLDSDFKVIIDDENSNIILSDTPISANLPVDNLISIFEESNVVLSNNAEEIEVAITNDINLPDYITSIFLSSLINNSTVDSNDNKIDLLEDIIDTTAPTPPTSLFLEEVLFDRVTLSFTYSSSVDVVGYNIYLNNELHNIFPFVQNQYEFLNLLPETLYTATIKAIDGFGNLSIDSLPFSFITLSQPDTTAPTVPQGVSFSNITSNSATVSWEPSIDNISLRGYNLYKNNTKQNPYPITDLYYTLTELADESEYTINVSSIDNANNESSKSPARFLITDKLPDTIPPLAVLGFQTTDIQTTSIVLSWLPGSDNKGISGYNIYVNNVKHNSSLIVNTNYTISNLQQNTAYLLSVEARDTSANIGPKTTISVETLPIIVVGGARPRPIIGSLPGKQAKTMLTSTGKLLKGFSVIIDSQGGNGTESVYAKGNALPQLKSNGFNTARVCDFENYEAGRSNRPHNFSGTYNVMDALVTKATDLGMYLILNAHLHVINDNVDWQNRILDYWRTVAPRYANNTNVIFELTNEPFNATRSSSDWLNKLEFFRSLKSIIQSAAPNTPILWFTPWTIGEQRFNEAIPGLVSGLGWDYNKYAIGHHAYDWSYTACGGGPQCIADRDRTVQGIKYMVDNGIAQINTEYYMSYSHPPDFGNGLWGQNFKYFGPNYTNPNAQDGFWFEMTFFDWLGIGGMGWTAYHQQNHYNNNYWKAKELMNRDGYTPIYE